MKKILFVLAIILCYGCEDIIGVEDISNTLVIPLAPSNEAVLTEDSVVFSWDAVAEAEGYRIQVARPNFENATQIVVDSLVGSTSFLQVLASGDYEWRIRAENSDYQSTYTTYSFTINSINDDISSDQVQLLAPAEGLSFTETEIINFSWEALPGANGYTIQIASPNFESAIEIVEDVNLTATSFSVSNLDANTYEWRVRAKNSEYQTAYTTQTFTVEE
ncbi:fibronectin type III domain-containing protein [Subsaximicrobium wynnwilliamsii]|uniref:Fibronectin type III domain-containing protein n=1 Tax=Subsaximicrobium wynnwilliamsii TaxID=291179 RepID=A0A5C6ZGN5_9FLAO|nr:fibronectin type III domain-containing protein [Subsaximicrobium wynnwilliamsii]TXD83448.1 fibronectin type III domain-containing protein [Subsaximicrobium wynnwilliamsii]TXD89277.1 fibronectin type III domain-containing protein [Subsaximicrobium wynnwilliamsii]TXE03128.1 fibronectin type III domain-containing protein [Subsaximicrobium wynnwilliamsii]